MIKTKHTHRCDTCATDWNCPDGRKCNLSNHAKCGHATDAYKHFPMCIFGIKKKKTISTKNVNKILTPKKAKVKKAKVKK